MYVNETIERDLFFEVLWDEHDPFILITTATMIVFFMLSIIKSNRCSCVTEQIPESCILILAGIILGLIKYFTKSDFGNEFATPKVLLNILVPTVILDGSYRLYSKELILEIFGVMTFAFFGTIFTILGIGLSLYAVYGMNHDISVLNCFVLGSILAAVDPVAVLAIFDNMGVKPSLYVLIFGESLFNDGVTLVVFEMLHKIMSQRDIATILYVYGCLSFFPIALGGMLIGITCGIFSAIITKYVSNSRFDTFMMITIAYLSFLWAQTFSWSGILSLILCGLMQRRYAFHNIRTKCQQMISDITETASTIGETIIFIMLGEAMVNIEWRIGDVPFIAWTIFFCFISRFIIVYALGGVGNLLKLTHISHKHLFVMSYGGLRGAIAYAMVELLKDRHANHVRLFGVATLSVIFFTIYVQGGTMKFLAKAFHLQADKPPDTVTSIVMGRITQHVAAGMESILGGGIRRLHFWIEKLERCDKKYIRPFLCRERDAKVRMGMSKLLKEKFIKEARLYHGNYFLDKKEEEEEKGRKETGFTTKEIINLREMFPDPNQLPIMGMNKYVSYDIEAPKDNTMWKRKVRLHRKKKDKVETLSSSYYESDKSET